MYLYCESQVRLLGSLTYPSLLARNQLVFRMRICIVCIRRVAHTKIVQTHMQTLWTWIWEPVYIYGPWALEIPVN